MQRRTYYLPAPMIAALEKLAKKEDVSVSELVRRAIAEFLARQERRGMK